MSTISAEVNSPVVHRWASKPGFRGGFIHHFNRFRLRPMKLGRSVSRGVQVLAGTAVFRFQACRGLFTVFSLYINTVNVYARLFSVDKYLKPSFFKKLSGS